MNLSSQGGKSHWTPIWILSILALIAACGTISPRRLVINNPSPTPTVSPTISPTPSPFPTPTISPTPTPTPTPMAAVVPSQFLFTADPGAGVILGFKINRDGGLSPVPGSPFVMAESPRLIAGTGENLFVAGRTKLTLFVADEETGTLRKADVAPVPRLSSMAADLPSSTIFASSLAGELAVRAVNHRIQVSAAAEPAEARAPTSVLDSSGSFMYTLDRATGTISIFTVRNGAPDPESLRSYPAGHGSTSLAILKP